MFVTDGQLQPNSTCDYIFESSSTMGSVSNDYMATTNPAEWIEMRSSSTASDSKSIPLNHTVKQNQGRLFSPQYPSGYPKGIQCSYLFMGQMWEQVRVVLEHVTPLKSDSSCVSSADVISVHDGKDQTAAVIQRFCPSAGFTELVSSSNYLFIKFHSRSHFPGQVCDLLCIHQPPLI